MVYIIARCVLEQLQKPHTVKKKNTEKLKRKTVYVSCRSRDREHQSIGYKLSKMFLQGSTNEYLHSSLKNRLNLLTSYKVYLILLLITFVLGLLILYSSTKSSVLLGCSQPYHHHHQSQLECQYLFCFSNLYCCGTHQKKKKLFLHRCQQLVLHKHGPLTWTSELVKRCAYLVN